MSNLTPLLAKTLAPLKLVRARAKVLAREDRRLRSDLVRMRRQNDLTQKDVAEMLGVTPQAVAKLERYDADPKLSTLRRYANAVGAIVEHRVTADLGQSVAMADASRWESNAEPGTGAPSWRVSNVGAPAATPPAYRSAWSKSSKADFILGA